MPTPILMPALSPTMEVGTLAKWHVKAGDKVEPGDVVAEIETDKATMEVEAVDEGTVGEILVSEGTADVPVNQPIAMLLGEGEDESALAGSGSAPPAAPKNAGPNGSGAGGNGAAAPAPAEAQAASERAPGGAADTTRSAPDRGAAPAAAAPAADGADGRRIFASPLARRLAAEHGIDLAALAGSGPHGRIVKRDVEKAAAEGVAPRAEAPAAAAEAPRAPAAGSGEAAAPGPAAAPAGMSDEQIRAMFPEGGFREIPHDGMRKTIARRLVESKQTVPHFYLTVDVELDALLKLRGEINAAAPANDDGKPAYKLSVNDFVVKALALSLKAVPMANVTFTSTARLVHESVDVGVAVALDDGLITPVIRNADRKSLSAISNEIKDLAARARARKLKPAEYEGGTTAVSNLGMYGIREFSAVINPPHGSILAVGAGAERAVVKDGAVVPATVMTATLSVDHRAIDGALGAELLAQFKPLVENPIRLLV